MPSRLVRPSLTALILLAAGAVACGPTGRYTRVEDIPEVKSVDAEYRIAAGDVVGVRVWNQDSMSIDRVKVREDGRISMPFLQDVEVAGQTPTDLASRLQVKLKTYVVSPVVTVTVHERRPTRVSVLGEVAKPGQYELDRGSGVLAALAAAGGLSPYAHKDRIFVLRNAQRADGNPEPARIRFDYATLTGGRRPAATFRLEPGDVVSVE
jgi:polysaccharide biosynthesis/export protein